MFARWMAVGGMIALCGGLSVLMAANTAEAAFSSASEQGGVITLTSPLITVKIRKNPLQVTYYGADGEVLLSQRSADQAAQFGPKGPFSYAVEPVTRFLDQKLEWDPYLPRNNQWYHATEVLSWRTKSEDVYELTLATNEQLQRTAPRIRVELAFLEPGYPSPNPHAPVASSSDVVRVRIKHSDVSGLNVSGDVFNTPSGESFYGFGQLWDQLDSRGKRRVMHIELDAAAKSFTNENGAPVPFYVSNRGYGVFAEMPTWGEFNMAQQEPDKMFWHFTLWGGGDPAQDYGTVTYYVIYGPEPLRVIQRFCDLSSMPPLPPKWNFGPHFWRNKSNEGERDVDFDLAGMQNNDIATSVYWFDAPWTTSYNDFDFNPYQFPDANAVIAKLNDNGYRLLCWNAPFMNYTDDSNEQEGMKTSTGGLFEEGLAKGYYLLNPIGTDFFVSPWWKGDGAWIDFTNPEAYRWYQEGIRRCVRRGVEGWKLDDGYTPDNATFHGGQKGLHKQFEWRILFHKIFWDALVEERPEGEGVLVVRTGNYGDQKYGSAFWPGDLHNDYRIDRGFPSAITAGTSLGVIGYPYAASDIGGFIGGTPAKDVFCKWIQYGAFQPVMQNGGGGSHEPWDTRFWDTETLLIYRKYTKLHTRLFPYIYTYAHRAHQLGHPVMRGLYLHHPQDPEAAKADYQYYFGEWLLCAPMWKPGFDVHAYFPEGKFFSYWDDSQHIGPKQATVTGSLWDMPLYVKSGAILPLLSYEVDTLAGSKVDHVIDYTEREHQRFLQVWPDGDTSFTEFDGTSYRSIDSLQEPSLQFQVTGAPRSRSYHIEFHYRSRSSGILSKPILVTHNVRQTLVEYNSLAELNEAAEGWYFDDDKKILYVNAYPTSNHEISITHPEQAPPSVRLAGYQNTHLQFGRPGYIQSLRFQAQVTGSPTDVYLAYEGIPVGKGEFNHDGQGTWSLDMPLELPVANATKVPVLLDLVLERGNQTITDSWPFLNVE